MDLEHDLPDELIIPSEPVLVNDGDLNQLNSSLGRGPAGGTAGGMGLGFGPGPGGEPGGVGGGQDAVAKHKQLSELLRTTTSSQQGHPGAMGGPGVMGQHLANIKVSSGQGPQQMMGGQQQHLSQQQANMMQQQPGMMGNRGMMGVQQKANNGQQQQQPGMMGSQVMNGSPRMGFGNQGMAGSGNMLADTLQQQGAAGPGVMRGQQHGAMNKVGALSLFTWRADGVQSHPDEDAHVTCGNQHITVFG